MSRLRPEVSWYGLLWRDKRIEAAMVPGSYETEVILSGGEEEELRELARKMRAYCDRPEGRALVYSNNSWSANRELEAEIDRASWDEMILPADQTAEIRSSIESFLSHRRAYRELGVAWRRGNCPDASALTSKE